MQSDTRYHQLLFANRRLKQGLSMLRGDDLSFAGGCSITASELLAMALAGVDESGRQWKLATPHQRHLTILSKPMNYFRRVSLRRPSVRSPLTRDSSHCFDLQSRFLYFLQPLRTAIGMLVPPSTMVSCTLHNPSDPVRRMFRLVRPILADSLLSITFPACRILATERTRLCQLDRGFAYAHFAPRCHCPGLSIYRQNDSSQPSGGIRLYKVLAWPDCPIYELMANAGMTARSPGKVARRCGNAKSSDHRVGCGNTVAAKLHACSAAITLFSIAPVSRAAQLDTGGQIIPTVCWSTSLLRKNRIAGSAGYKVKSKREYFTHEKGR
jgi:hypothetical protein